MTFTEHKDYSYDFQEVSTLFVVAYSST